MVVGEYTLNSYYHNLIVIEADDLTDTLKESIAVKQNDCFALCTSFFASDGELMFAVLSIGKDWDDCLRGIGRREELGIWSIYDVCEKEAQLYEGDEKAEKKCRYLMNKFCPDMDSDLEDLRCDARLDDLRDVYYPDNVLVGVIVNNNQIEEYEMLLKGVEGPFVVGTLNDAAMNHQAYEKVLAMPYFYEDELRLLALFVGDQLTPSEKEMVKALKDLSESFGVSFTGMTLRN